MLAYPDIDPVAVWLGPLPIRWYGLAYLSGFLALWLLGRYRTRRSELWQPDDLSDLIFYGVIGVIVGGRLGYVLFYQPAYYLSHPLEILAINQGGMAFHGGLLGVLGAFLWFARKRGWSFFEVADFVAPLVPPGLGAGRIANFINNELWGRVSDLPWAMIPPGESLGRHPSQLYQAGLEGGLLFLILWIYSARPRPPMAVSGLFLLCYGLFRMTVEFFRAPDAHIGYLAFGWVTLGQLLSLPMVIGGGALIYWAYGHKEHGPAE
ncbi:MAG: prolipoprotein diacylglyceryl transferase [Gammaproteobacteria bacterium]|nr:prolipoprotein diacylglyceryl transferase [Gammaproteobacteria bacterium]